MDTQGTQMGSQNSASSSTPHPMKKQILQHLLNAFLGKPANTIQDAISGMKGLMGAYKSFASEIDNAMPHNTVSYTRPTPPAAPPAYNPLGGNSAATMMQKYPNGMSDPQRKPFTPIPQNADPQKYGLMP